MFTMMPEKQSFDVLRHGFMMAMVWRRVSMRVWPVARSGRGRRHDHQGASAASHRSHADLGRWQKRWSRSGPGLGLAFFSSTSM